MLAIETPFPQFFDTDGLPLDSGYVYIGAINDDPETVPSPVWWDAAGTIPATQPLRTLNGYIVRNGTPAVVYSAADYSITVKNKVGVVVYYAANSASFSGASQAQAAVAAQTALLTGNGGANVVGWIQAGTGAVPRKVQAKLRDTINVADFGAVADAVFVPGGAASGTDNLSAFTAAINAAAALGITRVRASGHFYLSGVLSIPTGIVLEGDGTAWLPGYLSGVKRGTALLVNGANGNDCLAFAENSGHAGMADLSVYNTNTNAIRAVINITGHLHPRLKNIEIASLRPCGGIGLLLDSSVTGANFGTIYGEFFNVIVSITNIGSANEASLHTGVKVYGRPIPPGPANGNAFYGGSFAGKYLSLDISGTAAGTAPLNTAFFGVKIEGVYNTSQAHTWHAGGEKLVGLSLSNYYSVQFVKLSRARAVAFHGCYFELGGVPATYNDGTNGAASLAGVVWLDDPAEVLDVGFLDCLWAAHVYDNGGRTVVNPTYSGHDYSTRKAVNLEVRVSGVQAIPSAAFTKIQFGSVVDGDDAYLDWDAANNRAVVKVPGVYLVSAQVTMAGWATADTYTVSRIVATARTYTGNYAPKGGAGVPISSHLSVSITCAAGDTIEVQALHNQGGSQNTSATAAENYLAITKIG